MYLTTFIFVDDAKVNYTKQFMLNMNEALFEGNEAGMSKIYILMRMDLKILILIFLMQEIMLFTPIERF